MSALVTASDRLWVTGPRRLALRFPSLRGVAGDGHVVTTVPAAGVALPVVSLLLGLVWGLARLGYEDVWSESLLLVCLLVALGCFSSQLGALVLAGFVLGDVVSNRPAVGYERSSSGSFWFSGALGEGLLGHLLHVRVPDLITYLLLTSVVLVLPRAVRGAVSTVGRGRVMPPVVAWLLASGLVAVITWLGVGAWVAGAPTLVRPVFVWGSPGGVPTVEAIRPLQDSGEVVVAVAVAAVLLRQGWLALAMFVPSVRARLDAAESAPPPAAAGRPLRHSRPLPSALLTAALATLTLAGILEHVLIWPVAFAVFLTVRWLRFDQVRVPGLDAWRRVVNVAPAWARLIGLWLLSRVVAGAVSNDLVGSYTALAVVVLVSVVFVFAIFPGEPGRPAPQRPEPVGTPGTGP